MINRIRIYFILVLAFLLCIGCAGTIRTSKKEANLDFQNAKRAYIVSVENSNYIKFRFGVITPFAYIQLPDRPPEQHEVIGNTDLVIKQELEKYGINARIGKRDDIPPVDIDFIFLYRDTWRWDFKKILDKLEIVIISATDKTELARSVFNIHKNKEMHNFPNPEKEVPKMIKQLLDK